MTLLRRPSPFSELVTLRQAMDRLFDEPFFRPANGLVRRVRATSRWTSAPRRTRCSSRRRCPASSRRTWRSPSRTARSRSAARPSQEREEPTDEGRYLVREISRGSFVRTVSLPNGLEPDKAEATFENGVLSLRIPKAEQVKPRQIRISPVTSGAATRARTARSTPTRRRTPRRGPGGLIHR